MTALLLSTFLLASTRSGPIWVSPAGTDSNPGSRLKPVATLQAAVAAARTRRATEIILLTGAYKMTSPVRLGSQDSGLLIRSEGGKRVLFDGSVLIPQHAIQPCRDEAVLSRIIDPTARPKVCSVNLRELGVSELPAIQPRGFTVRPDASANELFAGRTPLTLARWPNRDYAKIEELIEPGNGETDADKPMRKPVFLAGDRPELWAKASDVWLYGYWKFDWADESIRADAIDPATGAITLAHPHPFGLAKGAPFYAENLLEELDAPGEYYIDRTAFRLYFIPPEGAPEPLRLSMAGEPFIVASKVSKLSVAGIDFAFSRGDGVHFQNCDDSQIAGCRFFDLGGKAVAITGGHSSGVQSCDIWNTGEGGVVLDAGDRTTLTSANDYVNNCGIYNYERRSQTYRPAVLIDGCGNRVSHCSIHDAPHSAIIYQGNNHLLSYNDVYRTITRTGDGGVFYTGRDWTARGTVISYNYFHDDFGQRKWEPAVYLDDQASGVKVTGNRIERCHWGFLIGGGRDNIVTGNAIIDCDVAFDCDARGLGWAAKSNQTLLSRLHSVPYQTEPWKSAYPALVNILSEDPMSPSANVIDGNLLVNSGKVDASMEPPFKKNCEISGHLVVAKGTAVKFKLLDPKSVGVFVDKYRRSLHD